MGFSHSANSKMHRGYCSYHSISCVSLGHIPRDLQYWPATLSPLFPINSQCMWKCRTFDVWIQYLWTLRKSWWSGNRLEADVSPVWKVIYLPDYLEFTARLFIWCGLAKCGPPVLVTFNIISPFPIFVFHFLCQLRCFCIFSLWCPSTWLSLCASQVNSLPVCHFKVLIVINQVTAVHTGTKDEDNHLEKKKTFHQDSSA